MTTLTICRDIGSDGSSIGKQVADALRYQFVDKTTLCAALKEYGFIHFESIYEGTPDLFNMFDMSHHEIIQALNEITLAFAKRGQTVIVGRGSFAVLQDYADVLNVRIKAPFDRRVKWLMKVQGIASYSKTENLLRQMDEARASFVELTYGVSLDDDRCFDLVLDMGEMSQDDAVSLLIESLLERDSVKYRQPADVLRTAQGLELDPVLADYMVEKFPVISVIQEPIC